LILLFGSDPQVHDLPRVMRIPGFPHQKDGSRGEIVQLVETIVADNYSEVQFQTALASALQQSQKKKIDRVISNLGSPPPDWTQGYPEGHRNNECARRAGFCFARGMTLEEALEKCLQWNRECNSPPLSDDEVAATVASIARTHSAKTGQNGFGTQAESNNANANSAPGGSPPHLPRILVVGGGLSNEASAGEDAILKAGWPIYQRGSMLVRPVVQVVDATCGRRTEVAQLAPIDLPYLKDVLCQSAEWYRWDARQKKHVRIDPPGDIAQTILHRSGQWKFPGVVGLITTQTRAPTAASSRSRVLTRSPG
jgi:Primase C terminal 1 (PriCT-1)